MSKKTYRVERYLVIKAENEDEANKISIDFFRGIYTGRGVLSKHWRITEINEVKKQYKGGRHGKI